LNDKLSHLLKEDVSVNRQLTSLVRALEAVSDVGIEYTVIGSIIELIPILITDCRVMVHSLYDGVLPTDVLNIVWKTGKHSHSSLKTVNSEVWVEHDMLSIVYYVPDFTEFTVFSLAFLPIKLETGSACVRVGTDQYVAAVGMDGQFFEYDSRNCVSEHGSAICSADRITIRTKPTTCNEVLVVGNFVTLPRVCADELKVGVCTRQEYLRNRGQVYIFTPYDDKVVYDCSGTQETRTLLAGTTLFKSSLCTIRTSELYIQSN